VSVSRAELPRHIAKPKCVCGIPGYDYRLDRTPHLTITAISLPKVNITPAPEQGQPRRDMTYIYQFREPRLQVDHCFLSRIAVTLHEDGWYQMSFRADQNPQPGDDFRSPLKPGERLETTLQTTQLKRNTFVVKFRGYAAAQVTQSRPGSTPLATPAIIEFPAMEFVVERGEPASKAVNAFSHDVKKYFPLIDRVEVEFTYK
jgi:hypothetical protein